MHCAYICALARKQRGRYSAAIRRVANRAQIVRVERSRRAFLADQVVATPQLSLEFRGRRQRGYIAQDDAPKRLRGGNVEGRLRLGRERGVLGPHLFECVSEAQRLRLDLLATDARACHASRIVLLVATRVERHERFACAIQGRRAQKVDARPASFGTQPPHVLRKTRPRQVAQQHAPLPRRCRGARRGERAQPQRRLHGARAQ